MPKILVLDELSQDGLGLLESAGNLEVEVRTGLKGDDLRGLLESRRSPQRRDHGRRTARQWRLAIARRRRRDNIDTQAATRQGIVV